MTLEPPDIVVVGAGSAGCMVTHELVTRFGFRVTLIEDGDGDAAPIDRVRPARWLRLLGSAEDHRYRTDRCESLSGRSLVWPRGRGVGGSSRINAMIWLPPDETDLAVLAEAGGDDWSIDRLGDSLDAAESLVRPETPTWLSEASRRFLEACRGASSAKPLAFRRFARRGRRWTAAALIDAMPASSLKVLRGRACEVVWQGDRAVGVVLDAGEARSVVSARRGVVLCAGAIESPSILIRSGIGPADQVGSLGIDLRVECDGVGRNLQDHLLMPVIFAVDERHRFRDETNPRELARWLTLGTGPLASNLAECGAFLERGRLQIHVTPTHYLAFPGPAAPAAMTIGVNVTRPVSRGCIRVDASDPQAHPRIDAGYLSEAADVELSLRGISLVRAIAEREPLGGWLGEELVPGARRQDAGLLEKALRRYGQTLYHPVGTCALGNGPESVLDHRLQVRGVRRLAVVDASVLPGLTRGNPSAALLMVARHGAGLIGEAWS